MVDELVAHAATTGDFKSCQGVSRQAQGGVASVCRETQLELAGKAAEGFSDWDMAIFLQRAKNAIVTGKTPEGDDIAFMTTNTGPQIKQYTYVITKVGRVWMEGKQKGKPYTNKIEISDANRDWKVGETHTFKARVEFESNGYGTTVKVFPMSDADAETENNKSAVAEIERWLGYVEDKAPDYLYANGVDKLRALGVANFPEHKQRLDAAIQAVQSAKAKKQQGIAEERKQEVASRIYLNVPYADKDKARLAGARWAPERRQWYVTGSVPSVLEEYAPTTSRGSQPASRPASRECRLENFRIGGGEGYGWRPMQEGSVIRNPNKDGRAILRFCQRPSAISVKMGCRSALATRAAMSIRPRCASDTGGSGAADRQGRIPGRARPSHEGGKGVARQVQARRRAAPG
ncbi:MAG: hypothetical protein IPJ52_09390 [Rhodocyclaceae bacterium]|nr:hypothetical protein [Rhodocyclaceae bacterium]